MTKKKSDFHLKTLQFYLNFRTFFHSLHVSGLTCEQKNQELCHNNNDKNWLIPGFG